MTRTLGRTGALVAGGTLLAAFAVVGPSSGTASAEDGTDCIPLGKRSGTITTGTNAKYNWVDNQCRNVGLPDRRTHVIRVTRADCAFSLSSISARATVALPGGFDRDEQIRTEKCPVLTVIVMGTMRAQVQLTVHTKPGDQYGSAVIYPV
ncbi:hypothetical protein [Yinghuangia seranimata]|uniref:hypothetical protein n=1 Tax=Yinghuangia seranimata TaxID=408067 RepID=UPI00248CEC5B|nr:hypothetical protein [Yinghuangia seranimata]MDI2131352.1 hypothetical protein [Yinghuangia seranimata]